MRTVYHVRGLDPAARRETRARLDAMAKRLSELSPRGEGSSLALWLNAHGDGHELRSVIETSLGTVYAAVEAAAPEDGLAELEEKLTAELRRRRRGWRAEQRRRDAAGHAQLGSAQPHLHTLRQEERRREFDELLRGLWNPLRRYTERELSLASAEAPGLTSGIEADDLLDELVGEVWEHWPRIEADSLTEWLFARLHERVDALAAPGATEAGPLAAPVDEPGWIHDNEPFWPQREELSLDDVVEGDGLDPHDFASAFEHVSPMERRALMLNQAEGLPVSEIAAILGQGVDEVERLIEAGMEKVLSARRASTD